MQSGPSEPQQLPWEPPKSAIGRHIEHRKQQCLAAYRENPLLVTEHANIERATAQGGYGRRQIYELVQNAADAMLDQPGGRIQVILTANALYCANEGAPVDADGVDAILTSHISMKRGTEIGRFGLGFKSVLGVTLRPEFYSRSGSFRFDPEESARRIRAVINNGERLPNLRLAEPIEPRAAGQEDALLADLMSWAATIVKLPVDPTNCSWLSEDIRKFPREFLLFCSHVGGLLLEDRTTHNYRQIRLSQHGDLISLEEGQDTSVWKVFETVHSPSSVARKDAGELADRQSLPLMWAVPMQGRSARGVFWAFFPTEYFTTLSGIVNAPWKTNEDRQNLLTGIFNAELIQVAAELIAKSLPQLVDPSDPAKYLDLLPARGREAPNWADADLTEKVYRATAIRPCIPDQAGVLHHPREMKLHPTGIPRDAHETWSSYPNRPVEWSHSSIETRDRRSRAERLFSVAGFQSLQLPAWLEALVKDRSVEASFAALKTASQILTASPALQSQIETARILRTSKDSFIAPKPGAAFIAAEEDLSKTTLPLVHPDIVKQSGALIILHHLGINEVDASSEFQALLASIPFKQMNWPDWNRFWSLVRRMPSETSLQLIRAKAAGNHQTLIKVRTLEGDYRPIVGVLLPGTIVPEDGSRDKPVTVDVAYHAEEIAVMKELGAVSGPCPNGGSTGESWYAEYLDSAVSIFMERLKGRKPNRTYLRFDQNKTAGPIEALSHLSFAGKARFTEALLLASCDEKPWTLSHQTQEAYGCTIHDPPALWIARNKGCLRTTLGGARPLRDAVGPALLEWAKFLPVAECSEETAERLNLPSEFSQLTRAQWSAAMKAASACEDSLLLGKFYARVSEHIPAPEMIRCKIRDGWSSQAPSSVTVVSTKAQSEVLESLGHPFLISSAEAANILIEHWGLLPADTHVTTQICSVASGAETPLLDRFPGLHSKVSVELESLKLLPCSSLRMESRTAAGKRSDDRTLLREGDTLFFIDTLTSQQLLDAVIELVQITLNSDERQRILDYRQQVEGRALTHAVRTQPSLAAKLLKAVGSQALYRRLPVGLIDAVKAEHGRLTDIRAAELVLAVYGVETLHALRDELDRNGLKPPVVWAGRHSARTFVKSLGFPTEFAGFDQARRDPTLEVEGPPDLSSLHPFQEKVTREILRLPKRHENARRGLLSLPTGAGKTRVAVQALIEMVERDEIKGPILWVAQSDELCEQAVQTWSYVWRALGPQRRLTINRLWASNEADVVTETPQVVVATIQKLQGCIDDTAYDWLAEGAAWVIIDEAHGAVEKSYTAVLEWLGLGRGADRCPVIGLTATPFRGGEDETRRLVRRFGGHRLDKDAFGPDPYRELQEMGVLAKVDHQLLEGSTLGLSPKELEDLMRTRLLPAAAGERLGADVSRNELLLQTIRKFPKDWPVLLFAASVEHAQTMAALLALEGVSSAAISGYTEAGARRHYIDSFRKGKLRVLTNFAVLTAGFDAPSVRAIIVARPTYSPVLYQQMIGRGLRGPLNGGKERCLIVNVKDNITQYGEELAFRQFEYLWSDK